MSEITEECNHHARLAWIQSISDGARRRCTRWRPKASCRCASRRGSSRAPPSPSTHYTESIWWPTAKMSSTKSCKESIGNKHRPRPSCFSFSFLLTPFDIFQKDLSPTVIVFLFRKQNTKTSIPLSRKLSTEPFLDLEMIIYHLLLLLLFEKPLVSAK